MSFNTNNVGFSFFLLGASDNHMQILFNRSLWFNISYNRSLRFNISYGKPDACDAEIYEAAHSAALGDYVDSLLLKLDSIVGEQGVRLSGVER